MPVAGVNVTPAGGLGDTERVGTGLPVVVTVKVLEDDVENVVAFALVNTGALLIFNVKLAVMADSVGTVVAPQEESASTATVDTLLRLMT